MHDGDLVTTNGCTGVLVRVYAAEDACGNRATATQVVTYLLDLEAPMPTITPAVVELGCMPTNIPAADASVFSVGNMCGEALQTNLLEEVTTSTVCGVRIVRTYQLTDSLREYRDRPADAAVHHG